MVKLFKYLNKFSKKNSAICGIMVDILLKISQNFEIKIFISLELDCVATYSWEVSVGRFQFDCFRPTVKLIKQNVHVRHLNNHITFEQSWENYTVFPFIFVKKVFPILRKGSSSLHRNQFLGGGGGGGGGQASPP